MNSRSPLRYRQQRGAIMVVSLLLLLVMTVLALSASQTTTLQERMAGNARDSDLAFQAAEAGLRDSEAVIAVATKAPTPPGCTLTDSCPIKLRSVNFVPDFARGADFWKDNTREYADAGKQIAEVISDPQVFTERRSVISDTLTGNQGIRQPSGVAYYTHTVRAKGGTDTATIVLQTVSAERFPK
jgi:type IV pilus assembly protein PilX